MQIYNTLTKKKEEFLPAGSPVRMFVCGPTVYDYIHIGNARTFVVFDVVAKWLRHQGYDLTYIQNITDIDDKIIARAAAHQRDIFSYSQEFENIFYEDAKALGITSPEYKRATDYIPEIKNQVKRLQEKGHAYEIPGDGIYFDLSTFPDYGKLSGRTASMADDAVSRIDDSDKKRNRGDFALWKFSQAGDPTWPAPFGDGRPGWHIEDTAITEKYFGPQYDIHGGGQDLIFPHHEAEITQQESASGLKPFVKYWMHAAFVVSKEQKMSKSAGNFETANELLKKYPKEVLRFYLLSGYYRSPLDFSDKTLQQSEAGTWRIHEFMQKLNLATGKGGDPVGERLVDETRVAFQEAMDDDFNTPKALSLVFDLIRDLNSYITRDFLDKNSIENLKKFFEEVDSILGIILKRQEKIPDKVQDLVETREKLREEKNWEEADKIRAQIEEMGWKVEDTIYGPLTSKK